MVFVLLARQRSGTGALGSVLDQHPQLNYLGEVFHPDNLHEKQNYFRFLLELVKEDAQYCLADKQAIVFEKFLKFIEETFGKNSIIDIKYRSTHHFNGGWYSPNEQPRLIHFLKQKKVPIIHLKRANYVKTFVSGKLADINKIWHAKAQDEVKHTSTVLDIRQLSNYLVFTKDEVDFFNKYLKSYGRVLELEYSSIFDKESNVKQEILEKLGKFLQIKDFESNQPAFKKQAPKHLKNSIENFELVKLSLNQTEFAWMLE